jgi:uncharacterized protein GlcG (DUF336 family)
MVLAGQIALVKVSPASLELMVTNGIGRRHGMSATLPLRGSKRGGVLEMRFKLGQQPVLKGCFEGRQQGSQGGVINQGGEIVQSENVSENHRALAGAIALGVASATARAEDPGAAAEPANCKGLPGYSALKSALSNAQSQANGGFNLDMWATVVNRDGIVCAVAFTGTDRGSEWPGSRVISAQKAYTANAFSLPGLALSTANLYAAIQPGGTLYGLQHSNPVNTLAAYKGPAANFGQANDPMVGSRVGRVKVFGGGLALYATKNHILVGAIGVSGDTSCADHNVVWRTRSTLKLDFVPGGVCPAGHPDNIDYHGLVPVPSLQNDFSHPICKIGGVDGVSAISVGLPVTE